jgi:hypothetical protein
MFSSKDYSKLSLDELLAEEKKIQKGAVASAFFIGMMVGVIFVAVMNQKYLIGSVLLVVTTFIGYKSTKDQKNLKAELSHKRAVE